MSVKLQPISEVDHLTRNPDITVEILTDFRYTMLDGLTSHFAKVGFPSYTLIREIERNLSTIYPYHDDELIDAIDRSWAKSQHVKV